MWIKNRVYFALSDHEHSMSPKLRLHKGSSGKQPPINLEDNEKINYTFLISLSTPSWPIQFTDLKMDPRSPECAVSHCFSWEMCLINAQSIEGSTLGMTFILKAPTGVCMWHTQGGWEFGGRMEMRGDLISISLCDWEIFFLRILSIDSLLCTFNIKLSQD